MPCIWGKHNNSQVFINVAILTAEAVENINGNPGADHQGEVAIFKALVDTGAQSTCITKTVADQLKMIPIGKVPVNGVSGVQYHNNYLFHVGFPIGMRQEEETVVRGELQILTASIQGAELSGVPGFDVLLGMDVICTGSLKIDGDGSYSFSF